MSEDVFDELVNAESQGSYFSNNIRDIYRYERLESGEDYEVEPLYDETTYDKATFVLNTGTDKFHNKEFAKRFSCYEHPFTGERITTAQGYLNAIKSQAAGHLIEDKGYLSVEELNREFKEFYKDFMPPDGMPIMNIDDYLREMDIQETLKMKAAEKVIYKKEAEKEEKNILYSNQSISNPQNSLK